MPYDNIYAIGDVQGCYTELQELLELVKFDRHRDQLWFVGDLVNRGPQSLEVLRFVRDLASHAITVLGNHELHLLAVAAGNGTFKMEDTLSAILHAPDHFELLSWLRQRQLLHHDPALGYTLVHAGIPPQWNISAAAIYAREVEAVLRDPDNPFWQQLYGNEPSSWRDDLTGIERLRYIINALTRMRFCTADGTLNLKLKAAVKTADESHLLPWFEIRPRRADQAKIIFGHWAALQGKVETPNVFALDTGCVWGHTLTAMRLQDQQKFSVPARQLHL